MQIARIDLTQDGIAMFVGPLSAAILELLWVKPRTGSELHMLLRKQIREDIAYTTIATTCTRLAANKLIERRNVSRFRVEYKYEPLCTKNEIIAYMLRTVAYKFIRNFDIALVYNTFTELAVREAADDRAIDQILGE